MLDSLSFIRSGHFWLYAIKEGSLMITELATYSHADGWLGSLSRCGGMRSRRRGVAIPCALWIGGIESDGKLSISSLVYDVFWWLAYLKTQMLHHRNYPTMDNYPRTKIITRTSLRTITTLCHISPMQGVGLVFLRVKTSYLKRRALAIVFYVG